MDLFVQLTVNGALVGLLYSLVALGFVLIVKGSGVINFAQGQLVLVGGYLVAWFTADLGVPLYVSLVGSVVLMVILGGIIERLVLRPLENEPLLSLVMATIAIGIILEGGTFLAWGEQTRQIPEVFTGDALQVGSVRIQQLSLWAAGISLAAMGAFGIFFSRSRLGLAMQAVSDDRLAAQSLGVNIRRVNAAAWAISGAVAAFGGFIWGTVLGVSSGLIAIGIFVFPVVILGGLESVLGALIGGVVVGIVQNLAGGYIDPVVGGGFSTNVAPSLLLLLVLIVRPFGLFGRPRIERV